MLPPPPPYDDAGDDAGVTDGATAAGGDVAVISAGGRKPPRSTYLLGNFYPFVLFRGESTYVPLSYFQPLFFSLSAPVLPVCLFSVVATSSPMISSFGILSVSGFVCTPGGGGVV